MTEPTLAEYPVTTDQLRDALSDALAGDFTAASELPPDLQFNIMKPGEQVIGPFTLKTLRINFGSCTSSIAARTNEQPPRRTTIRPATLGSVVVANPYAVQ